METKYLSGAGAISAVLFGEDNKSNRRKTYYLLERRLVPAMKLCGVWLAEENLLREHFRSKMLQGFGEAA